MIEPRPRRQRIPAMHVAGDLNRPALTRKLESAAQTRSDELITLADGMLAPLLAGGDEQARRHRARNIVTAIALAAGAPSDPPSIADLAVKFERAGLKPGTALWAAEIATRP